MIVDRIHQYLYENELTLNDGLRYEIEKLAGAAFKRQFMDDEVRDSKGKFWVSSLGKCVRQLAYQFHGIEKAGKEIDGRAKIVFWTGDLIEFTVVGLAKLSGVNVIATGLQQMRIELPVTGGFVSGRPDGLILENKITYLLEVKSMSGYGFEKFEHGELEESYKVQVNSEMEALGISKCVFVAVNKESGVMAEVVLDKDEAIVEKARKNIASVLHSTPEKLPDPPEELGFNEKTRFYPWNCLYCAWWKKCRTNAELVLVKNAYKLQEKKEAVNA